jgi:transposase-like protein
MRRRQFTAEFKTKIILELLREEKQIGELAAENDLSPNQLRNCNTEHSKHPFSFPHGY